MGNFVWNGRGLIGWLWAACEAAASAAATSGCLCVCKSED
jgi:hypothetical protein